jgi:predicted nucleotidyltransferase
MRTIEQVDSSVLAIGKNFAERIRALVREAKIILYGSAARGEMEEFSDIDIYVELPDFCDTSVMERQISDIAWEIGFENDKIIQAVVYRKSDVWERPRRSSPFIKAIHSEGVAL